jgi:hypothetical protein
MNTGSLARIGTLFLENIIASFSGDMFLPELELGFHKRLVKYNILSVLP